MLALGLLVSLAGWLFAWQLIRAEAAAGFQHKAAQSLEAIDRRIQENINVLIGLKGLFNASEDVSREEFGRYLGGFKLSERYTGLRLVAYARRVAGRDRDAYESAVRRDSGHAGFAISPPGDRSEYLVVEYLEPLAGNEGAHGIDLLPDLRRAAEIARARDSGEPGASGPMVLAADPQKRTSFVLRVPIYRRDLPDATVAQRRAAFAGMVTAAVSVEELIDALLGSDLDLVIRDTGEPAANAGSDARTVAVVLYDSRRRTGAERIASQDPASLKWVADLDVAGRRWQFEFASSAAPVAGMAKLLPLVVFTGGVVTSLLLFWLIWTLSIARARALKIAQQTTAVHAAEGLREQLDFIQGLIETVPQPIFFKDAQGRYLGVNKAWEKFFGIPRSQFVGKSVFELYPDNPALAAKHHAMDQEIFSRPGSQSYEAAIATGSGLRHTIYNKATFNNPDGSVAGLIGTITDVTELKETEAALRESEARFRDLTDLSTDWYWEQDAELRFTSAAVDKLGLDAGEYIGSTRWDLPMVGVSEEQLQVHRETLEARRPFRDFVYQRYDSAGNLRTISVSGRPIFDEQGVFRGYRGSGKDITEQKQAEERIRHMAHHDTLTGLPNRALLHDRIGQNIARTRRNGRVMTLLFIDLDRFKNVNDSLGHAVGDQLLKAVAGRLQECTRGTDTVARIGGDEFVIVLVDLRHPEESGQIAHKVLDALSEPFAIGGHELHVTPSIGICAYPGDGPDAETLMRNADTAMYHAKEMGRNNYQFFTPEMNAAAQQRLVLENDIRRALERHEFTLYYQPQIDLARGTIVGMEALVRWRHPKRGLIPPSEFIALAEETGLILPLGEWVLREACTQIRRWRDSGHPDLQVAVNLSARQFRREGIVDMLAQVLQNAGIPAQCLELEITEGVIMQHTEEVMRAFERLHGMGVQIAIDDFGTGYSSLGYLKRFPIDSLKIDQSFVRDITTDPDDAAIVTAIIAMAHSLGLEVVAEGVETEQQLAFLSRLRCDKAQGYHFGRPAPAAEFEQLLESQNLPVRAALPR